ncbi:hypothetical protein [Pararhodospirillum photometricum]|uniref:hypothetical protein n=1 Tax=Pararhodospirillum photometricum TaxID=1084 RepID=UPI0012FEFDAF|nr:hypothetical protein [Pararhodospirillum photometricum]
MKLFVAAAIMALIPTSAFADEWSDLVSSSDDYAVYSGVFSDAARHMVTSGICSKSDFKEFGGFVKSMNMNSAPVYFVYCGGMTINNRIYVDVSTGRVFK